MGSNSSNSNEYEPQHITEQIDFYKKQLTSFSKTLYKFSSELPHFMFKTKMVQADILQDLYEQSSLLEGLLREIMDDEFNGDTLRPIHYSCEHGHYCNGSSTEGGGGGEDDDGEGKSQTH